MNEKSRCSFFVFFLTCRVHHRTRVWGRGEFLIRAARVFSKIVYALWGDDVCGQEVHLSEDGESEVVQWSVCVPKCQMVESQFPKR